MKIKLPKPRKPKYWEIVVTWTLLTVGGLFGIRYWVYSYSTATAYASERPSTNETVTELKAKQRAKLEDAPLDIEAAMQRLAQADRNTIPLIAPEASADMGPAAGWMHAPDYVAPPQFDPTEAPAPEEAAPEEATPEEGAEEPAAAEEPAEAPPAAPAEGAPTMAPTAMVAAPTAMVAAPTAMAPAAMAPAAMAPAAMAPAAMAPAAMAPAMTTMANAPAAPAAADTE